MPSKILVVEDSADSFQLVKRALGPSYSLECAPSLADGVRMLNKNSYDLVLMDVMLPDGDGFGLCSILQSNDDLRNIPIIFLTAKNSVSDKVLGFQVGAEDFISKPFDPLELRARVEAKLRKKEREKHDSDIIRAGDLEINKSTQHVTVHENGNARRLDLTQIEFKLLVFLAKEPNVVFSRDEILNAVWGQSIHIYSRSVDTHVSKLRKKLGSFDTCIESVHGTGYRFVNKSHEPASVAAQMIAATIPSASTLAIGHQ
jgi:DNA-binding response OmpR family regulator